MRWFCGLKSTKKYDDLLVSAILLKATTNNYGKKLVLPECPWLARRLGLKEHSRIRDFEEKNHFSGI